MKKHQLQLHCCLSAAAVSLIFISGLYAADFSFVVIGDTRPFYGSSSYENFSRQIERVNSFNPAFMVNCGDLIYGYGGEASKEAWSAYRHAASAVKVPYHQLPGNHDIFSKKAQDIYKELFKESYYSFDYDGCHFVMLDNAENGIWGYISEAQYEWLENDLAKDTCGMQFVFMHLPLWVKEKINRNYYTFWKDRLHPLFRSHRVKAVFAGHIHSYGPTRKFDGIDYYITGGGGAELDKWYSSNGGVYHFMLIKVRNGAYSHSIVTDNDVLSEEQADVVKNVDFSRDNAGVEVVNMKKATITRDEPFSISLRNPSGSKMTGLAQWTYDRRFFALQPDKITIDIPPKESKTYSFRVKILDDAFYSKSLPALSFTLRSGRAAFNFSKDLVFHREMIIEKTTSPKVIDGNLNDWPKGETVVLSDKKSASALAEVMTAYDADWLYVAARVFDKNLSAEHAGSMAFLNDAFVLAIDRQKKRIEHGNDDLQLEISKTRNGVTIYNRALGEEIDPDSAGIRAAVVYDDSSATIRYELAFPASFLKPMKLEKGTTFGVNFALCNADGKGKTELTAWAPGIEIEGLDDSFRSQLHFAGALLK